jgi:hypothetical protein
MTKTSQALIVLAIAGAGFIAGRAGSGAVPAAFGEPPRDKKEAPQKPARKPKQQEKMAGPGEAHKPLELLLGDWDGEVKMWFAPGRPPMSFKETVKRESLYDKRYVMEHVEATSEKEPHHGMAVIGHNNVEKRYEMLFIDNGGTAMNLWTGTFDAEKKTFTFTGNEFDMSGKKVKFRTCIDCSNEDKQIKTGFKPGRDGKEFKAFEITLTRKK